jgi:hypothetical protein
MGVARGLPTSTSQVVVESAFMSKAVGVTVRVSRSLKRALEARARREHRSLSAQIVAYLERGLAEEPVADAPGRLLGLFTGSPVPSDEDFTRARHLLWGSLGRRRGRRGA